VRKKLVAATALLSVSVAFADPYPTFIYTVADVTVTDLGTLGGARSEAYDINNHGTVVGWSDDVNNVAQAFRYMDGRMVLLDPDIGPHSNVATGINNRDEVAGSVEHEGKTRAFRTDPGGGVLALIQPSPADREVESSAAAISDSGLVGGRFLYYRSDGRPAPTLSEGTVWTGLYEFQILSSDMAVNDINAAGVAVGIFFRRDSFTREPRNPLFARLITKDGDFWGCPPHPRDPRSCMDFQADALGINEAGAVVGYTDTRRWEEEPVPAFRHAYYWDGVSDESIDLGVLPRGVNSTADDVNNGDFVVGYADQVTGDLALSLDTGFLYHRHFGMFALPRPKFAAWFGHCRAKALNDRNEVSGVIQVVGTCDTLAGTTAVRWDVTVAQQLMPPTIPVIKSK
jgi:probable HAF family extracellular repeat protein